MHRLVRLALVSAVLAATAMPAARANPGVAHVVRGMGDFNSSVGAVTSMALVGNNQPIPGTGTMVGMIGGGPTVIMLACMSINWDPGSLIPPTPAHHKIRASGTRMDTLSPIFFSLDEDGTLLSDRAEFLPTSSIGEPCGAPPMPMNPVTSGDYQASL